MHDQLQIVDPLQHADWDESLLAQPQASFFHTAAWAAVLRRTYGYTPLYLAAFEGARPTALLPLMEVRSALTGRRAVSLPFTDFCEPVCTDAWTPARLFQAALDEARSRGWRSVQFRAGEKAPAGLPASAEYVGHRLALGPRPEDMFARLARTTRTAVRKAQKSGVTCEVLDSLDAVRAFYRLHGLTRRLHGLPPPPFSFFRNIHEHVLRRGHGFIVLGAHERRPVAGAVFFLFGTRAIFKYGASDSRFQSLRANDLVMWEGILRLASKGAGELLLGRTEQAHEGLRRFKAGLGAQEYPLPYHKFDVRRAAYVKEQDLIEGWHNRVFRALPIPLSRAAGALMYRHMA